MHIFPQSTFLFLQNAGEVKFEGVLVISWGVKKPIQLKIQDEKQIFLGECPIKSPDPMSPLGNKRSLFYLEFYLQYVQPNVILEKISFTELII